MENLRDFFNNLTSLDDKVIIIKSEPDTICDMCPKKNDTDYYNTYCTKKDVWDAHELLNKLGLKEDSCYTKDEFLEKISQYLKNF